MKSFGVYYWYVKMPRCGCVEHELEYIMFYVKKHRQFWRPVLDPRWFTTGRQGRPHLRNLLVTDQHITTKFCTCHHSTIMSCAIFCSDHFVRIKVRIKRNFYQVWIATEKLLMKWAPIYHTVPGHQQPWYWRISPRILFCLQHQNGLICFHLVTLFHEMKHKVLLIISQS